MLRNLTPVLKDVLIIGEISLTVKQWGGGRAAGTLTPQERLLHAGRSMHRCV